MMQDGIPKIEKTPYRGKALLITSNNELVVYRSSELYVYDLQNEKLVKRIKLPVTLWKRYLSKLRLFERILHIEARWGIELNESNILIQFNHMILKICLGNGIVHQERVDVRGNSLSVCKLFGIDGFDNQVIVGDYSKNTDRDEVRLFARTDDGMWRVIFAFEPGKVRHIHACVPDKTKNCVYILTGDLDSESGIWIAKDNFKYVEPLFVGKQMYRACQLFPINGKLYYASDSPSEPNYLYEIDGNKVKRLSMLNGTCIYGVISENEAYLSTTCEPEAIAKNKIDYWFSNKPGKGVVGRKVCVGRISANGVYQVIQEFEHDGLPLRLFQYGTVIFTNIVNGKCLCSVFCTKNSDNDIYMIE